MSYLYRCPEERHLNSEAHVLAHALLAIEAQLDRACVLLSVISAQQAAANNAATGDSYEATVGPS